MQIKKRYVVVAVLFLLGLTTFTFASPRQVEKQKSSKGISERVTNDKKENRSYAEALDAVEKAEENPTLETVETARNEIQNADDATVEQINQLEQRVEVVEETIDVAALVKEVETLAEVKETRETAKTKYPNAETEVNKLEEGDVKDNLVSRLEKVSRLLNDTEAPVVTGIEEMPTNKNEIVYVKDEFLQSVTIDGVEYTEFTAEDDVLKFEKKVTKEGTHTVVAIDKLGNETTKTFTIDKTAAKKNAVNANVNGYKNDVKEQYAINGKTVTAYITVTEELKENPTFTFYANGKEIATVKDEVVAGTTANANYPFKYTAKLVINEELVAEDGQLTFTVTNIEDKAGNKTADISKLSVNGKVLTLDRTANRVTFTTISTDNKNVEGKVYYVTAGDTVTFRMGVREKFSENPVVTIGGKEVTLEYVKYFAQPNHHEYRGTLKLDGTLTDGNLDITIAGSKDLAGNKGFYYQTNGKKVLETVTKKETTNGKSLVYDNTAPELNYVAILSKADNYKYAKNGDTIRFLVAYKEEVELNDNFTVTFNNTTKKLVRSGDKSKYEYIAEFKIPVDEATLAEGLLTFEVKGAQDKLGNEAAAVQTANHYKYNNVTYDRTAPVITDGNNIVITDDSETIIKVYKEGNDTPIAEVTGKEINLETYGGGIYKIVVVDAAGNEVTKEFELVHNVASVEELKEALIKGGKIVITEDINLTEQVEVPEGVEVVIDLNGKDLNLTNEDNKKLISNKGKLTIKNGDIKSENQQATNLIANETGAELVLDNINYSDTAVTNSSSIINKGKLTIINSKLNGLGSTNGNTLINSKGDLTLKNTEVVAKSTKGYVANIWDGNVLVEDSNLDVERGGLAILGGNVTINNTNIDTAVGGNNWRALYIIDGTENIDINVTVNGGKYVGYRDCVYVGHNDLGNIKVTINDGYFSLNSGPRNEELFDILPKTGASKKFEVTVKGGTHVASNLGKLEEYIADGYILNEENKVVKNAISVTTPVALQELFANPKSINGKTIILENDLDMTGIEWKAANGVSFTLDGNGHTIKNLSYTTDGNIGIFVNHTAAKNLTFKNLTIDNANLKSTGTKDTLAAGFFVGTADTADSITIKNCTVKNSKLEAYDYAGGFIGYTAGWNKVNDGPVYSDILIEDSSFLNNTIKAGGSVGGAVAHAGGNPDTTVTIKNFKAENNVLDGETGKNKTGIVVGTAHVGKTIIENVTQSNNTVLGVANSNAIYGRFVPNSTGTLTIDGTKITN